MKFQIRNAVNISYGLSGRQISFRARGWGLGVVIARGLTESEARRFVHNAVEDAVSYPHREGDDLIMIVMPPRFADANLPPVLVIEPVPESTADRRSLERRGWMFAEALWMRSPALEPEDIRFSIDVPMRSETTIGTFPGRVRGGIWKGQRVLLIKPQGFDGEAVMIIDKDAALILEDFFAPETLESETLESLPIAKPHREVTKGDGLHDTRCPHCEDKAGGCWSCNPKPSADAS
jgi:hypothetical protein